MTRRDFLDELFRRIEQELTVQRDGRPARSLDDDMTPADLSDLMHAATEHHVLVMNIGKAHGIRPASSLGYLCDLVELKFF